MSEQVKTTITPKEATELIEGMLKRKKPLIVLSSYPLHFREGLIENVTHYLNKFADKANEFDVLFVDEISKRVRMDEIKGELEDATQKKVAEFLLDPDNQERYRAEALELSHIVGGSGVIFEIAKLKKHLKVGWTEVQTKLTALASFGFLEFDPERPTVYAKFILNDLEIVRAKTVVITELFNQIMNLNSEVMVLLDKQDDKTLLEGYVSDFKDGLFGQAKTRIELEVEKLRPRIETLEVVKDEEQPNNDITTEGK